ncbi:hypothetical protein Tco_0853863 [Tanacetum coccineum]
MDLVFGVIVLRFAYVDNNGYIVYFLHLFWKSMELKMKAVQFVCYEKEAVMILSAAKAVLKKNAALTVARRSDSKAKNSKPEPRYIYQESVPKVMVTNEGIKDVIKRILDFSVYVCVYDVEIIIRARFLPECNVTSSASQNGDDGVLEILECVRVLAEKKKALWFVRGCEQNTNLRVPISWTLLISSSNYHSSSNSSLYPFTGVCSTCGTGGKEGQPHSGHGELEQRCFAASLLAQYTKVKGARSGRFNNLYDEIDIESITCAICDDGVETSSHLFFSCCMVRQIGCMIARWWDVPYVEVDSHEEWISCLVNLRISSKHKLMIEGVFYVMWWHLWSFRNKLMFDVKTPSNALFFEDVVSMSFH